MQAMKATVLEVLNSHTIAVSADIGCGLRRKYRVLLERNQQLLLATSSTQAKAIVEKWVEENGKCIAVHGYESEPGTIRGYVWSVNAHGEAVSNMIEDVEQQLCDEGGPRLSMVHTVSRRHYSPYSLQSKDKDR